jgi:hypothetical protein
MTTYQKDKHLLVTPRCLKVIVKKVARLCADDDFMDNFKTEGERIDYFYKHVIKKELENQILFT